MTSSNKTVPVTGAEGFVLSGVFEHMAEALNRKIKQVEDKVARVERLIKH